MKNIITTIIVLTSILGFSQRINPKNKWYFGAEIGYNQVKSFAYNEGNSSMSIGGIAEYYFEKHWSIQGRIKYIKTGVSFINDTSSGWNFNWIKTSETILPASIYNRFDGQTLVIPIDIKWEFNIIKNLHGSLKTGPALNIELKSKYNYGNVDYSNFSSTFVNWNVGYGINYYISKKYCVGVDLENYLFGASKGTTEGLLLNHTHYATNFVINLQLKYHF